MKCPGQDMRFWKPEDVFEIPCLKCGRAVEFFKDDVKRTCRCGESTINPRLDFGCAQWCEYGEQCLGFMPPELEERKQELARGRLKDKISQVTKKHFAKDTPRIRHALAVARFAEDIARKEGGNPLVLLASAYLHEIDAPAGESTSHHADSPAAEPSSLRTRVHLEKLGLPAGVIDEIGKVIRSLTSPGTRDSLNEKIFFDAHTLVTIEEEELYRQEGAADNIAAQLTTPTGQEYARKLYVNGRGQSG